ncbi:hypothetical protein FQN54_009211 [Arachnomyces sp. PD_36]|nr:hypothetical protein FQN54_009211 [Arachnomyces sp. PD_36]
MNNTTGHGPVFSTAANVPGMESYLESFIPGFSLISKLFSSYFNVDISTYISAIPFIVAAAAGLKYCAGLLWEQVQDYCTSVAEIRLDDEMYNYLMYWVSLQDFSQSTNRFVAGTRTASELVYASDDEDDDDDKDDKDGKYKDDSWAMDDDPEDNYWAKMVRRDKFKDLRYTPSNGMHIFWYKGRCLAFTRVKEEKQPMSWITNPESLFITCLGRDPAIIKDLLEEAQRVYVERDGGKTVIYRGRKKDGAGGDISWVRCMARHQRPLSTVVLDQAQKEAFVDDVKEYLHPLTKRWYSNRGIPYRRGYLLHGPPGTGKTSLCFAAAGLFDLRIYVVSLNSGKMTEDGLASLFLDLPRRCIVLLEDIDSAGITRKRAKNDSEKEASTVNSDVRAVGKPGVPAPEDAADGDKAGISLSALLNIIDGVASSEGRILIMTTNHPEKLDDALLRPGRVDLSIAFGYADTRTVKELFCAIYTTLEGDFPPPPGTHHNDLNGAKHTEKESSPTAVRSTKGTSTPANKSSEKSNFISSSTFRRHRHQYSDTEIASRAEQFASKIPEGKFTPAEIQGYLLKYKNDPDSAVESVADWVSSTLEEKGKKAGNELN